MPVFIIMYQLLRGLTNRIGGSGSGVGQLAGQFQQGVELTPWVFEDQNFRPLHLNPDTSLYQSLSNTNSMEFLGMDLALTPSQALKIGLLTALPFFLLLGIMLATGLYQNKQLRSRNKDAAVNPQQQMIMKIMPFFLPIFSFGFPAGLSVYWCTQNLCRIGTNAYITRSIYGKEQAAPAGGKGSDDEPPSKGSKRSAGPDQSGSNGKGSGGKGSGGTAASGKESNGKGSTSKGSNGSGSKGSGSSSSNGRSNSGSKQRSAGRKSGTGSRRRSGESRPSGSANDE